MHVVAVVNRAAKQRQGDYVFPGVRSDKADERHGVDDAGSRHAARGPNANGGDADGRGITVPGFRSTFRDWVAEKTTYANKWRLGMPSAVRSKAAYRRWHMF